MDEPRFVLDTSAWLTLIEDEDGAETVEGLIRQAEIGTAAPHNIALANRRREDIKAEKGKVA